MNADAPITLRNRHTGGTEVERVFGEAWLKRIYGNPLGKLSLHAVVKRAFFSDLYGLLCNEIQIKGHFIPKVASKNVPVCSKLASFSYFLNLTRLVINLRLFTARLTYSNLG